LPNPKIPDACLLKAAADSCAVNQNRMNDTSDLGFDGSLRCMRHAAPVSSFSQILSAGNELTLRFWVRFHERPIQSHSPVADKE
jgi:hypothetical protein